MNGFFPICFLILFVTTWTPIVVGQELPAVGKPLQNHVERMCGLDMFTPMLYEGMTMPLGGGKSTFTFKKSCAELQGQEYSTQSGKALLHAKSLLTWSQNFSGTHIKANDQLLELPNREFGRSLRIVPMGRMSLVDFGKVAHVYDNTEQHWCPFALTFPTAPLTASSPPLYWYDKDSRNIIRLHQQSWGRTVSKTQHYLPAVCSSSQTPMAAKLIIFKFGKDIPVNTHTGPVVVTY